MRIFSRGVMLALCAMLGFAAMTAPADAKGVKITRQQMQTVCGSNAQTGGGHTGCIKPCAGGHYCDFDCNNKTNKCEGTIVFLQGGDSDEPTGSSVTPTGFEFALAFVNEERLQSSCDNLPGGTFGKASETYICTNSDCDGKGGTCEIYCMFQQCVASMPDKPAGDLTLIGILQNGDTVIRGTQPPALGSVTGQRGPQPTSEPVCRIC